MPKGDWGIEASLELSNQSDVPMFLLAPCSRVIARSIIWKGRRYLLKYNGDGVLWFDRGPEKILQRSHFVSPSSVAVPVRTIER